MTLELFKGPFNSRKAGQELQEAIRSYLMNCKGKVGDPFYSDAQLVEASGLSRKTVRKAITSLHEEGWIERYPGRGTFLGPMVSMTANGMINHRPESSLIRVAVVLHIMWKNTHLPNYYSSGILKGLDDASLEEGISIEILGYSEMSINEYSERLIRSKPDVVLVMSADTRHAFMVGEAERQKIPCIAAGGMFKDAGIPVVCEDGEQGMRLAVSKLVEREHRKIGLLLSQTASNWPYQRFNGFMNGLREHGLQTDSNLVLWTPHIYEYTEDESEVPRLYNFIKDNELTGLIVGSSGQHTMPLDELFKHERELMNNLDIICFDQNFEDYRKYFPYRPDVITIPLEEIGRTLAKQAAAIVRKAEFEKYIELPCGFQRGDLWN